MNGESSANGTVADGKEEIVKGVDEDRDRKRRRFSSAVVNEDARAGADDAEADINPDMILTRRAPLLPLPSCMLKKRKMFVSPNITWVLSETKLTAQHVPQQ